MSVASSAEVFAFAVSCIEIADEAVSGDVAVIGVRNLLVELDPSLTRRVAAALALLVVHRGVGESTGAYVERLHLEGLMIG